MKAGDGYHLHLSKEADDGHPLPLLKDRKKERERERKIERVTRGTILLMFQISQMSQMFQLSQTVQRFQIFQISQLVQMFQISQVWMATLAPLETRERTARCPLSRRERTATICTSRRRQRIATLCLSRRRERVSLERLENGNGTKKRNDGKPMSLWKKRTMATPCLSRRWRAWPTRASLESRD